MSQTRSSSLRANIVTVVVLASGLAVAFFTISAPDNVSCAKMKSLHCNERTARERAATSDAPSLGVRYALRTASQILQDQSARALATLRGRRAAWALSADSLRAR